MTATMINVRPGVYADSKYVYATSRRLVMGRLRDKPVKDCGSCMRRAPDAPPCDAHAYLDVQTVRDLVDHLIAECDVRIATLSDLGTEIQGFIVQDRRDASIEFLHLREMFSDMPTTDLGAAVVQALLGAGAYAPVTLRRHPSPTTLAALAAAAGRVVVRPRSV